MNLTLLTAIAALCVGNGPCIDKTYICVNDHVKKNAALTDAVVLACWKNTQLKPVEPHKRVFPLDFCVSHDANKKCIKEGQ